MINAHRTAVLDWNAPAGFSEPPFPPGAPPDPLYFRFMQQLPDWRPVIESARQHLDDAGYRLPPGWDDDLERMSTVPETASEAVEHGPGFATWIPRGASPPEWRLLRPTLVPRHRDRLLATIDVLLDSLGDVAARKRLNRRLGPNLRRERRHREPRRAGRIQSMTIAELIAAVERRFGRLDRIGAGATARQDSAGRTVESLQKRENATGWTRRQIKELLGAQHGAVHAHTVRKLRSKLPSMQFHCLSERRQLERPPSLAWAAECRTACQGCMDWALLVLGLLKGEHVAEGVARRRVRRPHSFDNQARGVLLAYIQDHQSMPTRTEVARLCGKPGRRQDLSDRRKCPTFCESYAEMKQMIGSGRFQEERVASDYGASIDELASTEPEHRVARRRAGQRRRPDRDG